MQHKNFDYDPSLRQYQQDFDLRVNRYQNKMKELVPKGGKLKDFAGGHLHFGFHKQPDGWIYREWAPAADQLYLTGDFCGWDRTAYPMEKGENGTWQIFLPGTDTLKDGMKVSVVVQKGGIRQDRIPLYARRVLQDPQTGGWCAVIYDPEAPFVWSDAGFKPEKNLFIYECRYFFSYTII